MSHIDDPRGRAETAQQVVDLLNEAARLDPEAVLELINARVPCNEALNAHPTIQTGPRRGIDPRHDKRNEVGLLGILNGIFGTFEDGRGCIVATLHDDRRLSFALDDRPGEE